jgi:very-short-patch-repair endonuclease
MARTEPDPNVGRADWIAHLERKTGKCAHCLEVGAAECHHLSEARDIESTRINPHSWMRLFLATKDAGLPMPGDVSPIEARLLETFWEEGFEPACQYQIGPYTVDFCFPDARLVVEADGAEWHKDEDRDARRQEQIERMGWHVVHFTGKQIKDAPRLCVKQVAPLIMAGRD